MNPPTLSAVDPLSDKRWCELIKRHPSSSIFHTKEWLAALRLAYHYESVVYTTCKETDELTSGIVFCKVKSWLTGHRLVSLPFSDHCDPLVENASEFNDLLSQPLESVGGERFDYYEVRPTRLKPNVPSEYGQSDHFYWHVIDLRPRIDTIERKLHNSIHRKLRRAKRERLRYEEGNSEQLLSQFYRLMVETRKRQYLPPQPSKWFRSLMTSFGPKLKIRVAYNNENPIASILTLENKNAITYKYGCSDARLHSLGGVTLLLWNTIQQAKYDGCEILDLGRCGRDNEGLATFKEHWGGVRSDISYWRYPNHPPSSRSGWKKRIVEQIVTAAPNTALIVAGNLLYRHMG